MRLNKRSYRDITRRIVTKVFEDREAAIKAEGEILGAMVRERLLPADIRAHVDALPKEYFGNKNSWGHRSIMVQIEGPGVVAVPVPEGINVPRPLFDTTAMSFPVKGNKQLIDRIIKWAGTLTDLAEERKRFTAQTEGTVRACTTTEKLLKLLPDAKDFIPTDPDFVPVPKRLPVEAANTINLAIKKAVAAEARAA